MTNLSDKSSTDQDNRGSGDIFATTRWTVVVQAGNQASPQSEQALEELCRGYWYPLYAYVRRCGSTKEDAEDRVQGFFARFLQKNYLAGLSSKRGRFRAFLLASLKHYLANEWDKAHRQKRGGHAVHLSLNWHDAETRYHLAPTSKECPDRIYDREWGITLLECVIRRLGEECDQEGKAQVFEQLKVFLTMDQREIRYAQVAREIGSTEGAARVAVHRLRKRYRELLRDEIAQTLSDPHQVNAELQALFEALGS